MLRLTVAKVIASSLYTPWKKNGADTRTTLDLMAEAALQGMHVERAAVVGSAPLVCPECSGEEVLGTLCETCLTCNGRGEIEPPAVWLGRIELWAGGEWNGSNAALWRLLSGLRTSLGMGAK
jgi:hypothetical protein